MSHPLGEPGQELNLAALPGQSAAEEPTRPRAAATVIVLRGGDQLLEVLLVKRNPRARFMGGVWVFPGGAVDADQDVDFENPSRGGAGLEGDRPQRAAAIRELREEAGVELEGPDALVQFSRWITPAQVKTRYDTHFYLALMPDGQQPRVDGEECVDLGWFTPAAALDAHRAGEIALVFPTIKHLEQLAAHGSAEDLLAHARDLKVEPVLPRVVVEGDTARVLLPSEPGY